MGSNTKIEWTDHTFNLVHGCTKVSPACDYCYAESWDSRHLYSTESHWGPQAPRLKLSDSYWKTPLGWNSTAARKGQKLKVFCSSMADVFEEHADLESERLKLWPLIEQTPNLIWQLLTKRPHNIMRMIPARWATQCPENIWAMTTAENQTWFDARARHLKSVPAKVLGFSCEPLLGPIDFGSTFDGIDPRRVWIIAGGESSKTEAKCRPTRYEWFAALRDQCQQRGIAFLFKQWGNRHEDGAYTNSKSYRLLDGREWNAFPAAGLT